MTNIFLGPELADVNFPNLCWILLEPKVNPSPIQMKIELVLVSDENRICVGEGDL